MTRNEAELLATPLVVTITPANPGKSALGTGATIFVSVQEVGVAEMPPIVTVLPLEDAPNPVPLIVKGEPTGLTCPTVGEMLLICGAAQAEATANDPITAMKAALPIFVSMVVP